MHIIHAQTRHIEHCYIIRCSVVKLPCCVLLRTPVCWYAWVNRTLKWWPNSGCVVTTRSCIPPDAGRQTSLTQIVWLDSHSGSVVLKQTEMGRRNVYEDVYSPHRQKTQKYNTKNRLKYDETIQYNILQYSRVKEKKYKYIYFIIAIL